ncbi:MAG: hypothetical protein KDI30_03445 [Pseudomonadales bacterium]|nr:hypothetical protein [Pseudomonadales bacterium]
MNAGFPKKVMTVLGMHRSGTSCLAGCLEQMGVDFGGHGSQGSEANQRGNKENRAIAIFHENILRFNGGSWHQPPSQVSWAERHYSRAEALLAEYGAKPCIAFKDPRTLLHLEHWERVFDRLAIEWQPVAIYRHPLATAQSLEKRDQFPLSKGLELWAHYNRQLLALHDSGVSFRLFSFEWSQQQFEKGLTDFASAMVLEGGDPGAFFTRELKHFGGGDDTLPAEILALYQSLQGLSG